MENPHIAVLEDCYRAWHDTKAGSVEKWLDHFAPDACFLSSASGRAGLEFTKPCEGLDDVKRYFAGLTADWKMNHYTIEKMIADGDTVMVSCSTGWTHRKTGKSFDVLKADVFTFADGKIVRFMEHYDTMAVMEAAS